MNASSISFKSKNLYKISFFLTFFLVLTSQEKKSMIHKVQKSNGLKREYEMLRGKYMKTTVNIEKKKGFTIWSFFRNTFTRAKQEDCARSRKKETNSNSSVANFTSTTRN